MPEIREQTEEQRQTERRQERQGWLMLIGGFALAGCLVVAASLL